MNYLFACYELGNLDDDVHGFLHVLDRQNDVAAPPVPVRYRPGKSLFFAKSYGEGLRKRKGVRYPHGRRPRLVNYTVNKSS